VEVSGNLAYDFLAVRDSVYGQSRCNALAAADSSTATVMVWNYHDDDITEMLHVE
jgi:xylan 1,4-beta-xylosidase